MLNMWRPSSCCMRQHNLFRLFAWTSLYADRYLHCCCNFLNTACIWYMEVWELKLYFYPSAGGFKKKKEKKLYENTASEPPCSSLTLWAHPDLSEPSTHNLEILLPQPGPTKNPEPHKPPTTCDENITRYTVRDRCWNNMIIKNLRPRFWGKIKSVTSFVLKVVWNTPSLA